MKKMLVLVILMISHFSIAQDYRFGKVSKEELMETVHPDFPEANAAILYKKQNIRFVFRQGIGFMQENEVYERIKIYNKEGFDYATHLVKLYSNSEGSSSNNEELFGLKGITYTLVEGKIEEDKLKKDGIFEEKTNKYWKTTKFTMPNIQEGCIIEFEYTIQSQNIGIDDISLQKMIPINKMDFKVATPEYFQYKSLLNPKATYIPNLSKSVNNESFTYSTKSDAGTFYVRKTEFSTSKVDYRVDIIEANLTKVPPLKDEEYVDNVFNYQAKLIMELNMIKYPNEPTRPLSTTWEKVTKIIYDDPDFGIQLNKKGYYDNDLSLLLKDVSDPILKASLIFNHVKSKVKWNGYNGYTADVGVARAYKDGTGNSADINLMLISMLRYAGLDANPILVSTKNNGIPLLPTRTGFNYVICGLVVDDSAMLLDATQKFTAPNILPLKSLNWLGRLIRKDESSDWIDLTPTVSSKELVSLNFKLNSNLSAIGKVRRQFTDYQAFVNRERNDNFSNDQMIESIEKGKAELEVTKLEIENFQDVSQPLTQIYEFSFPNALEDIGGKLYLSPLLFLSPTENPFKEDKREYPIDFVYPISDKYIVNIMLPEGYSVDSLPQSTKMEFNGKEGSFTYLVKENGSMLQLSITIDINKALILSDDYEQFKKFYQFMIEKQKEKIVLKKV
ncbi:transglutaminase [Subsaxibacter sp. CAU 1640]|uniref:transglutaminase n=1 Tax=Subsaxibacter sp. CAU 1640 TaxID=2933271 RepID=UPI002003633A|nr:transglutaminase [Subsaxibacter sp. CAU 1640]MCK7590319.1 transglutaminase [Subsaxibacter sp. CAU 1640]